jgi:aminoglycoside phosphotransferase (APT) family kinase protein
LPVSTHDIRIVRRDRGTFNAAVFVDVHDNGVVRQYVVQVPGQGTHSHWTPEDDYLLEREAQLIEYICENINVPVPEVLDYETGHDNVLGFPYIVMTKLPGKTAASVWFPEDYDPAESHLAFRTADAPPPEVEKKRITFLRSLARIMTEI